MAPPPEQRPLAALARLGIRPEDIDIVINTHLHWDHCYNNHLFPRATIYAQRAELQYAIAPLPLHTWALAGDNVPTYENLPGRFKPHFTPNGIHVNLEDYYRSWNRLARVGGEILPSHDARGLDRERYERPAGTAGR